MPSATVTFRFGHSSRIRVTSGKIRWMDLAVRHQVNRIELVVLVKRPDDLRQVLSRERLAAREDQHAEIAAESFRDLGDLVGLHLQFFRGRSSSSSVKKQCVHRISQTLVTSMFRNTGEIGRPTMMLA